MNWELVVDRVVVHGAPEHGLSAAELAPLIERAVASALTAQALPAGRAARAHVEISTGRLTSASQVAGAVAQGVARAVRGGAGHG